MRSTHAARFVIAAALAGGTGTATLVAQTPGRPALRFDSSRGSSDARWSATTLWLEPDAQARDSAEEQAYQRGKSALDERRYDQALVAFREVAKLDGSLADAAFYWQAYTLNKLGQRGDALEVIADVRRRASKSRWADEARALEMEIRAATGQTPAPETEPNEELKLLALNALMNSEPERAVPMLGQILEGTHSTKLKDRALFVLAQSDAPEARTIIARVARGQANSELQGKALQYLGLHGGRDNRQLLAEIYESSSDSSAKRRILQSFMITGERNRLLTAARSEANLELRVEAVRQLGVMGANEELWQLYQGEAAPQVKQQIIQALFVAGNTDRMIELANKEKDPDLRGRAVRNLGLIGSVKAGDALLALYGSDSNASIRREVIQSLFLQNNAPVLIELARKESNPELKRAIVQKLSVMDSKEALDYMMEILGK